MTAIDDLSDAEACLVGGGWAPAAILAARVIAAAGAAEAAEAAKKIIEVGEKIHDAVCPDHS